MLGYAVLNSFDIRVEAQSSLYIQPLGTLGNIAAPIPAIPVAE